MLRHALCRQVPLAVVFAALSACGSSSDQVLEAGGSHSGGEPLAPSQLVARDEATDDASAAAGRTQVQGTVNNETVPLPHAIVLTGRVKYADEPEAMIFVLSDQPGLCQHLQQGTLPKDSTMMAIALLNAPNGFVAGTRFLPGAEQGVEEEPMASAYLRSLDGACHMRPGYGARGLTALYGQAVLGAVHAGGATLAFRLELEDDRSVSQGTLAGQVEAVACDAPLLFSNAVDFFDGKIEPGNCR